LPPRLKGCFDPQVLTTIRDGLAAMNPDVYKGLQVSTLPQDQSIGVMPGGFQMNGRGRDSPGAVKKRFVK
jgi:hypothetical protein